MNWPAEGYFGPITPFGAVLVIEGEEIHVIWQTSTSIRVESSQLGPS
jgi:hypothetical protein